MRIDRYIRSIYSDLTQGAIEKALRAGCIKVSSKKIKSNYRVSDGDEISLAEYLCSTQESFDKEFSNGVKSLASKLLNEYLIEENEHFIAINKPTGLATQGGSKIVISVDHSLEYLNSNGSELRIVHRLDKDTSGVLLISKTRASSTALGDAFKNKKIVKKYLAILNGVPKNMSGTISSYLEKVEYGVIDSTPEKGKIATTEYKVLGTKNGIAAVEFTPLTGRMHQIRCHAAYNLKCPIIGDKRYSTQSKHRLMLHAKELVIPAEVLGSMYTIEARESGEFLVKLREILS
jgi:23S rRNA pseudouridine955/2504/2580 synthase